MKTKIVLLLVAMGLCCVPVQADKSFTVADYLVKTGEYDLRKGDIESAVREFSRAVMMDPNHEKAKEYLMEYGMDSGMYNPMETQAYSFGRLARVVKNQRDTLVSLKLHNTEMDRQLVKVENQRDGLSRNLTEKNLMIYDMKKGLVKLEDRSEKFNRQVRQIEKVYQQRAADLEMDALFDEKVVELTPEQLGRVHVYEDELISLQEKYNNTRETHFMEKIKRDAAYTAITDYVLVRSRVVDDLRDDVLKKDIEVVNQWHELLNKMDALDQSLEDIKHLRAEVDMNDSLLKEKQDNIIRLREELSKMNSDMEV